MNNGLCYHHGGAKGSGFNPDKPTQQTHGRYSKSLPSDMVARYEYYKSDPEILSLIPDLALARTMMERFMAGFVEGQGMSADVCEQMRRWHDTISKVAERCNKILNGETISIPQLGALAEQYLEIVAKHVTPQQMEQIRAECRRVGGKGKGKPA